MPIDTKTSHLTGGSALAISSIRARLVISSGCSLTTLKPCTSGLLVAMTAYVSCWAVRTNCCGVVSASIS